MRISSGPLRIYLGRIGLAILLLLVAGCAGPLAGFGPDETDEAIESAAADESFPDAAQAGIATK